MKLGDLFIKLGLKSEEFSKGINKAKTETNGFGNAIKKIGGYLAAAFSVHAITAFTKELVTLGGEAEGVRAAFERIGNQRILEDLKNATRGTVSEINLMKRAVQASNLGLPIEQLSRLFEFATKRAQETGQSVDYLVDSIVLGIGRKSVMILDNLGISSVQLGDKLKEITTGVATTADYARAVGEIAAKSMKESGDIIETNAIRVERLVSAWADFKLTLAEDKDFNEVFGKLFDVLTRQIEMLPSGLKTSGNALKRFFGDVRRDAKNAAIDDINKSLLDFNKTLTNPPDDKGNEPIKKYGRTISEIEQEISDLKESLKGYGEFQTKEIQATLRQIDANEKLLKSLLELRKARAENRAVGAIEPGKQFEGPLVGREKYAGLMQVLPALDTSQLDDMTAWIARNKELTEKYTAEYLENFRRFKEDFQYLVMDFGIDVVGQFGSALGELMATGQISGDFGRNIIASIGQFISTLGKMLIGLGVASQAFQSLLKSAFTNPASAIATIAAGAALVALGGAISSYVKSRGAASGQSGGGSGQPTGGFGVFETNKRGSFEILPISTSIRGNELNLLIGRENRRTSSIS